MFNSPKLYLLKKDFVNKNMSEISDFNKRTHSLVNIHIFHTLRTNLYQVLIIHLVMGSKENCTFFPVDIIYHLSELTIAFQFQYKESTFVFIVLVQSLCCRVQNGRSEDPRRKCN